MLLALGLFLTTYILMLAVPRLRMWAALGAAAVFVVLGCCGLWPLGLRDALLAVDYNVLLMIGGTMGTVALFIESKMPARLAELLICRAPNVKWAVIALALFAGIISAFVDNVATVLMVAPVGLAIARRLEISPVPVLISIAVSSNLQGAATLVGDTTSILLGGFAKMSFLDFFWMQGRPGIFWGVELGALATVAVLLALFRDQNGKISARVETAVTDYGPTVLLVLTVLLLIAASFLPEPEGGFWKTVYGLRSGLICAALCAVGVVRACLRAGSAAPARRVLRELDGQTLALLVGLFIVIAGIEAAGVVDAVAALFLRLAGGSPFRLYTLLVAASVALSAFIDNIPYVAAMLPVVQSIAAGMGAEPYVFYFGLLTGATLGGNLTPIGASANIAAIGILRKNGFQVSTRDFLRIGVPFTLTAVLVGYGYIWLVWG